MLSSTRSGPSSPGAAPKTALVLSGGGARGAYEVGILKFLREELPRRLGYMPRIDIVCGTSVGAINAAYVAATAEDPARQALRLESYWRSLRVEEMYQLGLGDVMRAARLLAGGAPPPAEPGQLQRGGLLNTEGLERFLVRHMPWRRIGPNVAAGHLEALSVSATHLKTGNTVVFVERQGGGLPPWSKDPFVRARAAEIGPLEVMASAAIPVLFPAVPIDGSFYCDGGLRQNTPISPALRLGADRVLVISLRHLPNPVEQAEKEKAGDGRGGAEHYPSPWFVFGKALNALNLDHTDYDLDRLRRMNAMIEGGVRAFGERFLDELNEVMVPLRGQAVRYVKPLLIRPSTDIGKIAARHAAAPHIADLDGILGRVIRYVSGGPASKEADLLSYLLFDGDYCRELIDLGMSDARAREDELVEFFDARAALQAVS